MLNSVCALSPLIILLYSIIYYIYNNICDIIDIYIYIAHIPPFGGFPSGPALKNPPAMQKTQETWVLSLEDPLEEGMATNSSILAWRIPWIE